MAYFGFWIFVSVFVICDTYIFLSGRDSFLHKHLTDDEKVLQQNIINKSKQEQQ